MYVAIFNTGFNFKVSQNKETQAARQAQESNLFEVNKSNSTDSTTDRLTAQYITEMAPAMDLTDKMINNVDILSKLNANELTSVALSASSKANSIISSLKSAISGYVSELAMVMNNPSLSDAEKERKIKHLVDKLKAAADEATSKVSELYLISETMVSLSSTVAALRGTGFNVSEFTNLLKEMLSTVNTKPSDLSEAQNKTDMYDIIDKNKKLMFGEQAASKMQTQADKADKSIKNLEEKLKKYDLTREERKRIQSELVFLKAEKNLLEALSN